MGGIVEKRTVEDLRRSGSLRSVVVQHFGQKCRQFDTANTLVYLRDTKGHWLLVLDAFNRFVKVSLERMGALWDSETKYKGQRENVKWSNKMPFSNILRAYPTFSESGFERAFLFVYTHYTP